MTPEKYLDLKQFVIDSGYEKDIDWSESCTEPENAFVFFCEATWVILNSGIKNQVAEKIWKRVQDAILKNVSVHNVFHHKGKADAIEYLRKYKKNLFIDFIGKNTDKEKLDFLESLPWIGPVTKYHLGKNLGMDICKPDRHLIRIAKKYNTTPELLCRKLSDIIGDRIATVDYVIWRSANLGKL